MATTTVQATTIARECMASECDTGSGPCIFRDSRHCVDMVDGDRCPFGTTKCSEIPTDVGDFCLGNMPGGEMFYRQGLRCSAAPVYYEQWLSFKAYTTEREGYYPYCIGTVASTTATGAVNVDYTSSFMRLLTSAADTETCRSGDGIPANIESHVVYLPSTSSDETIAGCLTTDDVIAAVGSSRSETQACRGAQIVFLVTACDAGTRLEEVDFFGNGAISFSCSDLNECSGSENTCDVHSTCSDTAGSFTCLCHDGWEGDGVTCTDVPDCGISDNCDENAVCQDGGGTYTCRCEAGWSESGNGTVCDNVDECDLGISDCHSRAQCADTDGSFTCPCDDGYYGTGTGSSGCMDIDECANPRACDSVGVNRATCDNSPAGTFTCTCINGFEMINDRCVDIDDCSTNSAGWPDGSNSPCHPNAVCNDLLGGYSCDCLAGYTGDGQAQCTDVDECALDISSCNAVARCINTAGGYDCECNDGWDGNGISCENVNECQSDDATDCDHYATCQDTDGSYFCDCDSGFVGDGVTCEDVDECADPAACHASATCTNIPETFMCACNTGWTGDGTQCSDIRECQSNDHTCHRNAACLETPGSCMVTPNN